MNIDILDCTLRDGGYINDWKFTDNQIKNIIYALETSKVDIIECGYLNDKKGCNNNSTLFRDTRVFDKFIKDTNKNIKKVVMINLGDYKIDNLPEQKTTFVDGVRLAFHKQDLELALKTTKEIIELGYKVYLQPMVTKNYTDMEFLSLIEQSNQLKIYAFYIVDSFGSMMLDEFQRYLILANKNLKKEILLGYHSHNNMQLAFSNAISMINTNFKRKIIIDASIYGIGRGAGNLNTELITDYLNNVFHAKYEILPLLEIIDELLSSMMQKNPWGFSPAQYLSSSFDCHPNYATYLINKNTNHIVGVKKVLELLPQSSKNSFDKDLIERLYRKSTIEMKTDPYGIFDIPKDKKILLIASGKSVLENKELIGLKVDSKEYFTIALNHKPDFECDIYFFSNQKRFDEFSKTISDKKQIVITSNIASKLELHSVLNIKKLVEIKDIFVTNVAIVVLNYLISKDIKRVEIAGLDGYKINENNYNYDETSVITNQKELIEQNQLIENSLKILTKKIDIKFLTLSIFKKDK